MDRNTFLETLREVAEIAKTSQEPLDREQIRQFFGEMELSEEQEEMIYQYLKLSPEEQTAEPDEDEVSDREQAECAESAYEDTSDENQIGREEKTAQENEVSTEDTSIERLSDSAYYRMYLDEVKGRGVSTDAQQKILYEKLLSGDNCVAEDIVNNWLMRIIGIAKVYKSSPVNVEDLIQEGNMGLVLALGDVPSGISVDEIENYLTGRVTTAMENYIREVTGNTDWMQAVLGKAALLHEAREFLAGENGQSPSLRQLSEYTHIPPEEIQDILALYEQK